MSNSYIFVVPYSSFDLHKGRLYLEFATKLTNEWPEFGKMLINLTGVADFFACYMVHGKKLYGFEDHLYCTTSIPNRSWFLYIVSGKVAPVTRPVQGHGCCRESSILLSSESKDDEFYESTDGLFTQYLTNFFGFWVNSFWATGKSFRLCTGEPSIRPDGSQCTVGHSDLPPLMTGFDLRGHVYLFGKNGTVWVTQKAGFDEKGSEAIPLLQMSTRDFFTGKRIPTTVKSRMSHNVPSSDSSQNAYHLGIYLGIGALFSCLFFLLLCIVKTYKKKTKSKKNRQGQSSGKAQLSITSQSTKASKSTIGSKSRIVSKRGSKANSKRSK